MRSTGSEVNVQERLVNRSTDRDERQVCSKTDKHAEDIHMSGKQTHERESPGQTETHAGEGREYLQTERKQ